MHINIRNIQIKSQLFRVASPDQLVLHTSITHGITLVHFHSYEPSFIIIQWFIREVIVPLKDKPLVT